VTANFTVFYEQLGWDVRDPMAVTKELVRKLRPQADIIVVISHLGLPNDQHMAEEIPGIDCIFGGHTHHLLTEPLRIGDTYIFGAGKFGKYVGEAEIHFDAERRVITSVTGRCIDVDPYPSAARIVRTIARNQALSQQNLSEAVAWLRQPLEIDWRGESILGNLLAAGIKKWTKAEIGIVNAGQIIGGLNAGEITREMLLKVCPSPINPCRMWVTGRQIWKALEESLLPEFVDKAIRGFGFRGQVLGTLCLDGLHVEYDPTRKSYEKITGIWVNGQSLDKEREYLVGTIDMFTFGVGYTSLQAGRDLRFYLPEFIRDILQQQLQNQEEISRVHEIHWLKR
jgi:2',3'-cyclic-nucleotide 2'-phosphodiesterase (5'-nucleotidase family)